MARGRSGSPTTTALADTDRDESVAQQVLDRRLVEEFERFQTRRELEVVRVLPRS
jgi:hypothetical protein